MEYTFEADIKGEKLIFSTTENIFSPRGIDRGTMAMLAHVDFTENDKVLDLGCGCGVVGILAARIIGADRVVMCDIDDVAVNTSMQNARLNGVDNIRILQSDGLGNIEDRDYTLILSNPPYHTDFSVAKRFIEDGFKRLKVGGKMLMVTKRLDWYRNKLTSVFGGAMVYQEDGYFVFISEKRQPYMAKKSKRR